MDRRTRVLGTTIVLFLIVVLFSATDVRGESNNGADGFMKKVHDLPHVDFRFKRVNSTFDPTRTDYVESIIFPGVVIALISLVITVLVIGCFTCLSCYTSLRKSRRDVDLVQSETYDRRLNIKVNLLVFLIIILSVLLLVGFLFSTIYFIVFVDHLEPQANEFADRINTGEGLIQQGLTSAKTSLKNVDEISSDLQTLLNVANDLKLGTIPNLQTYMNIIKLNEISNEMSANFTESNPFESNEFESRIYPLLHNLQNTQDLYLNLSIAKQIDDLNSKLDFLNNSINLNYFINMTELNEFRNLFLNDKNGIVFNLLNLAFNVTSDIETQLNIVNTDIINYSNVVLNQLMNNQYLNDSEVKSLTVQIQNQNNNINKLDKKAIVFYNNTNINRLNDILNDKYSNSNFYNLNKVSLTQLNNTLNNKTLSLNVTNLNTLESLINFFISIKGDLNKKINEIINKLNTLQIKINLNLNDLSKNLNQYKKKIDEFETDNNDFNYYFDKYFKSNSSNFKPYSIFIEILKNLVFKFILIAISILFIVLFKNFSRTNIKLSALKKTNTCFIFIILFFFLIFISTEISLYTTTEISLADYCLSSDSFFTETLAQKIDNPTYTNISRYYIYCTSNISNPFHSDFTEIQTKIQGVENSLAQDQDIINAVYLIQNATKSIELQVDVAKGLLTKLENWTDCEKWNENYKNVNQVVCKDGGRYFGGNWIIDAAIWVWMLVVLGIGMMVWSDVKARQATRIEGGYEMIVNVTYQ